MQHEEAAVADAEDVRVKRAAVDACRCLLPEHRMQRREVQEPRDRFTRLARLSRGVHARTSLRAARPAPAEEVNGALLCREARVIGGALVRGPFVRGERLVNVKVARVAEEARE